MRGDDLLVLYIAYWAANCGKRILDARRVPRATVAFRRTTIPSPGGAVITDGVFAPQCLVPGKVYKKTSKSNVSNFDLVL